MSESNTSTFNKALIGAALAGLSCFATEASAATVVTETTDFSNSSVAPTDLSSSFVNFLNGGGVAGQMIIGTDYNDSFSVNVTPNTLVSIPWSVSSTSASQYFWMNVYNAVGGALLTSGDALTTGAGTVDQRTLNFTTPASGKITFQTNQESGAETFNYTVGATVPEPTTGLLGLAGLAAAALRRRREGL